MQSLFKNLKATKRTDNFKSKHKKFIKFNDTTVQGIVFLHCDKEKIYRNNLVTALIEVQNDFATSTIDNA